MANTAISGLTASATNLAAADVLPIVQTTGVGPVKMTGQQLAGGLLGSTTLSGTTITANAPVVDFAQTWNNAAVTFTGMRFNVPTDTSNAASLLMDLQVGGSSRLGVGKNGRIFSTSGPIGGVALSSSVSSTNFFEIIGDGGAFFCLGGNIVASINRSGQKGIGVTSDSNFNFNSSATSAVSNGDTILTRRGAANLRLGAADTSASATVTITIAAPGVVTWSSHGLTTGSPVVFSTTGALPTGITAGTTYYAVVVDANSFQFATSFANAIAATPTVVTTSGSQSGTQTARKGAIAQQFGVQDVLSTSSLENIDGADFVIRGSRSIGNKPGGSIVFRVAPAGSSGTAQNALATALTINANRSVFVSTSMTIGDGGGINGTLTVGIGQDTGLVFTTRGRIFSGGDGVFTMRDNAGTSFGRLTFGGTTSSFPALKRSTTFLQARLADDSGDAGFSAANVQAATAYTVATLPTPATGMIARVTDATAPVIGMTVAGGGAAYALVNYNGANWTVIGV
jgi:hypothetical protein